MNVLTASSPPLEPVYPCGDGEPVVETFDHLYALLITLEVLRQYLVGEQATVLGNQYLYYAQGFPRLRTAPDVMVIFNVEPGGRDNYKIWEEGQVPSVIFEMTSASTRDQDQGFKRTLYEQLGVQEYWQFDPKGEWIAEQLRGYRLQNTIEPAYAPITDGQSQPLQLRLQVEGRLIAFYRLDTGEKLLIPEELAIALRTEQQRAEIEYQRAETERKRSEELAAQLERYRQQFGELPAD
uniref:Putative restriction endonuclease domain-containing protein n=1 Tax=Cyanothece sp. (strain PCC 7425 / ATCC 29141) TaxID=395961 RepID=B8HQS7_CYAP4